MKCPFALCRKNGHMQRGASFGGSERYAVFENGDVAVSLFFIFGLKLA
jgi:hypothetical protein